MKEWLRVALPVQQWGGTALKIAAIAAVAVFVHLGVRRAIRKAARHLEDAKPRSGRQVQTAYALLSSAAGYAIFFIALLMILREAGVNTVALLGGAGVVGLAVGFGAQNLVRDVVTGFFIIFEGQYGVGDNVEINGVLGVVEEIGLRVTKVRTPRGDLRFFPNGTISSVNTYTEGHIPLVLHVPVAQHSRPVIADEGRAGAGESPAAVVEQALADFDAEFRSFAAAAEVLTPVQLSSGPRVLRFGLKVFPDAQGLVEQKLPVSITAAFSGAGIAVADGREICVIVQSELTGRRS